MAVAEIAAGITSLRNPNLLGIGFQTAIGSVLLGVHKRQVLEMIAKLRVAVEQMREPS
jgi:hypothetical protein